MGKTEVCLTSAKAGAVFQPKILHQPQNFYDPACSVVHRKSGKRMRINKRVWLMRLRQELCFYTWNELTHKAVMAIPARRGCGRNAVDEGIRVKFIQISLFKSSDVHFQGVSPFSSDICKTELLPISTIDSTFISSLLLLCTSKEQPEVKHLLLISILYSAG